jgi:hypothetical protein
LHCYIVIIVTIKRKNFVFRFGAAKADKSAGQIDVGSKAAACCGRAEARRFGGTRRGEANFIPGEALGALGRARPEQKENAERGHDGGGNQKAIGLWKAQICTALVNPIGPSEKNTKHREIKKDDAAGQDSFAARRTRSQVVRTHWNCLKKRGEGFGSNLFRFSTGS